MLCVGFCHGFKRVSRIAKAKLDNKQCKLVYIDENPFNIICLGKAKSIVNIEPWTNQKEKAKVTKEKKKPKRLLTGDCLPSNVNVDRRCIYYATR